jgi:hypothetical protein
MVDLSNTIAPELEISNLKLNPGDSNTKKPDFIVTAAGHEVNAADKVEYIFKINYTPNAEIFTI